MRRNRLGLVALSGTLLCTAATGLHAQPWAARHGLTPAQYQASFNEMTQQGYRLVSVSGYVSSPFPDSRWALLMATVSLPVALPILKSRVPAPVTSPSW